ncbi:MAG TPA: lytic transglycosylase domain-containing protein [Bryobacteraceae bacterium]|nr:lytic transglycosylase domain-containing protein [Bryobacteraceae bacterium]
MGNPIFAGESALLSSGSRLHVDRHESLGAVVRLYNAGGSIELSSAQIVGFEPDEPLSVVPAVPIPAAPPPPSPQQLADAAADKYGLPRQLVRRVMAAESNFQPHAVSPKGAIGLMQLMPQTAQLLGVNPQDSAQNVDAGARYLRELLEKYHGALYHALAAYNAGAAAVDKYNGIPPFAETIHYVSRIAKDWGRPAAPELTTAESDPASRPK